MNRWKSIGLFAAAACAGMLFQAAGCANLALQQVTTALDFCAVLNCTGGSFFNLCDPVILFYDCPNA